MWLLDLRLSEALCSELWCSASWTHAECVCRNLRLLELAGAEIVPFSPIADAMLPDSLAGIYLGGGYPECHAAELAANKCACVCTLQQTTAKEGKEGGGGESKLGWLA